MLFFNRCFYRFWDGFWVPKFAKMSTSCRRDARFHKIAFSDVCTNFGPNLHQKGFQNRATVASKSIENTLQIFIGKIIDFGSKLEAKWSPNYQHCRKWDGEVDRNFQSLSNAIPNRKNCSKVRFFAKCAQKDIAQDVDFWQRGSPRAALFARSSE